MLLAVELVAITRQASQAAWMVLAICCTQLVPWPVSKGWHSAGPHLHVLLLLVLAPPCLLSSHLSGLQALHSRSPGRLRSSHLHRQHPLISFTASLGQQNPHNVCHLGRIGAVNSQHSTCLLPCWCNAASSLAFLIWLMNSEGQLCIKPLSCTLENHSMAHLVGYPLGNCERCQMGLRASCGHLWGPIVLPQSIQLMLQRLAGGSGLVQTGLHIFSLHGQQHKAWSAAVLQSTHAGMSCRLQQPCRTDLQVPSLRGHFHDFLVLSLKYVHAEVPPIGQLHLSSSQLMKSDAECCNLAVNWPQLSTRWRAQGHVHLS